jgi:hypothetical protein
MGARCFLAVCAFCVVCPGWADRANEPDFKRGAVYGHVQDSSGKPIPDAIVAIQSAAGDILAWAKTDATGDYALNVDPKAALNMNGSPHAGLLKECATAVGDVLMAPVNVVTRPGPVVRSGLESIAYGTPVPLAEQAAQETIPVPNRYDVQGAAAKGALGDGPTLYRPPVGKEGQAELLVVAPGCKDADLNSQAYWFEGPKERGKGLRAWVETVKMAPAEGGDKPSVVNQVISLTGGTAAPSLVPPGESVKISVKLGEPPDSEHPLRVFARESRRGEVVELKPDPSTHGFCGQMHFGRGFPSGPTTICIAAVRADPVEIHLPRGNDPFPLFVRRLEDMQPNKPYQYDPMIMGSVNRLDLKVIVLPPQRGG